MNCVIEGNFFKVNRQWIVKELAFIVLETGESGVFTFKPPYPFKKLSDDDKRQCRWISHNICDLRWDDGERPYSTRREIFDLILGKASTFFTKGLEKSVELSAILGVTVTNIEDFGCPKLSELEDVELSGTFHFKTIHCALRKAKKISKWMFQRESEKI